MQEKHLQKFWSSGVDLCVKLSPRVNPGIWNPLGDPVVQVCGMSRGHCCLGGSDIARWPWEAEGGMKKEEERAGNRISPSQGGGNHGASGGPKGQLGGPGSS